MKGSQNVLRGFFSLAVVQLEAHMSIVTLVCFVKKYRNSKTKTAIKQKVDVPISGLAPTVASSAHCLAGSLKPVTIFEINCKYLSHRSPINL